MKFNFNNKVDKKDDKGYNKSAKYSPKEVTEIVEKEIGEQLKKIKEFEAKGREQINFDMDSAHNLTIIFESTEERNEWAAKNKLKIMDNHYIIAESIKKLLP